MLAHLLHGEDWDNLLLGFAMLAAGILIYRWISRIAARRRRPR